METKSQPASRVLRFGVFQINIAARELRKHGVRVRLPGQPFCILSMLLEKPGEILTRDEIRQRLWASDTFVDFEHSMNSAIKKLRAALGDTSENSRYVETIPRVGYRFIAPVEVVAAKRLGPQETPAQPANDDLSPTIPLAPPATETRPSKRWPLWTVVSLTLVCVLAGSIAAVLHFRKPHSVLHAKDMIVIGTFENFSSEPVFDSALRQGLIVGMQQSPFVQVLSDHRSAEILRQMGHAPEERLASNTAIELCQRTGSKVLAQGAIRNVGANYVIDLTALRCDNGESVAQEQVLARRKEDVIEALGQATARMRAKLGESLPSIEKYNAPLEQATTPSLEALKAYGLGTGRWDAEGDRVAAPYFERAVELDPSFAMAYGALAAIHGNEGELEQAKGYASKAYEHRERATGIERLLIESWYDIYVTGDVEKAAQIYEIGLRDYPENTRALNDLGVIEASLGNYNKGVEIFRQVLRVDTSSATTYGNLAMSLMALNQVEEAGKVLDEAEKRQLSSEYMLQVRYWHAFLRSDDAGMQHILALSTEHPLGRAMLLAEEANTKAYAGQLQNARESMESAGRLMLREGDKETSATILAQGAVREAEFGESAAARQLVARALKLSRGRDVMILAAVTYARIGDFALAEKLSGELNPAYPMNTEVQKYWTPVIRAQIALRRGDAHRAVDVLDAVAPYEMAAPSALTISTLFPAYIRGEALLLEGNGARAAAEFQKVLNHPGMTLNYPIGPSARVGLARSLAQQKEFAKARTEYQQLFQVWQGADPNFRMLNEAKAEFEKLREQ